MRRTAIDLAAVADHANLARAAWLAGRGKRERPEVATFFASLEGNLARLGVGILDGSRPLGRYRAFQVCDPKPRTIHAPCFEDRVLHHALFAHLGPVLERAMVDSAYACRAGKGPLAAVHHAQRAGRAWPWFVQVDVAGYFDHIDHQRLLALLARRVKGAGVMDLIARIIATYRTAPGRGLPIGTLASQYFANLYLDPLDRFIREGLGACDHVRYMDDTVWWSPSRTRARADLRQVRAFAAEHCGLQIKPRAVVGRPTHGLAFLGYRVLPGCLRLSRRRRRSYADRRAHWEAAHGAGRIDALTLQQAMAAVHGITTGADALGWRRRQLALRPSPEV